MLKIYYQKYVIFNITIEHPAFCINSPSDVKLMCVEIAATVYKQQSFLLCHLYEHVCV